MSKTNENSGINIIKSALPGCVKLEYAAVHDHRGSFVKTFNESAFRSLGLEADFAECFYSISGPRVLRGMHFQRPPADHAKVVYCLEGRILDVAVDLRRTSPTLGGHAEFELSADCHNAVYLPRGIAHGFYVMEAPALVMYHVSSEYDPLFDGGIRWDSFGFDWPDKEPVVSRRDSEFATLHEYESPFLFQGQALQND